MKKQQTVYTDVSYANMHYMTAHAAAKRHHTDMQITISQIESEEMDNSENIATMSSYS